MEFVCCRCMRKTLFLDRQNSESGRFLLTNVVINSAPYNYAAEIPQKSVASDTQQQHLRYILGQTLTIGFLSGAILMSKVQYIRRAFKFSSFVFFAIFVSMC